MTPPAAVSAPAAIEVALVGGYRVRLESGFEPAVLTRLLDVLEVRR